MILGVNIDHVATLRRARGGVEPDPILAVPLVILGGADGITVHLREDRRHIVDRDLYILREITPIELNLEMAATSEMIGIARKVKPDMVTIVPEKRQELTTEGGLDVAANMKKLKNAIKMLHDAGIGVSLFVNPSIENVSTSKESGADMVEIHTGMYANSKGRKREGELKKIYRAAQSASEAGLFVNAGHGLNYYNVTPIAEIDCLRGLYIGHSIIAKSVFVGLERAVSEMKTLIESA